MPLFRKKKKPLPTIDLETYAGPNQDPFEAVPRPAPRVETLPRGNDVVEIRRRILEPTRIGERLARLLHLQRWQRVNLDPVGTYFWSRVDETNSLQEIARDLNRHTSKPIQECRSAVLTFTRDLMARNMIQLRIEDLDPQEKSE